eukprot:scaffold8210_cov175-Amphora_coffeaeformis.AAC.4
MMIKAFLSILALSNLVQAEDLLRHRKEHYVIPESDSQITNQKLEDERDRLRHEDDFKVECSGKAGKMAGGKMNSASPVPTYSRAPISVECSGKYGKMQGGKMSPSSETFAPASDSSDFEGYSGKMYGGKMSPSSATFAPVSDSSDFEGYSGKMYGGQKQSGKMSPSSETFAPASDSSGSSDFEGLSGKMHGGKMYGAPTASPSPFSGLEILDVFGPTPSPAPGGKMYGGKMNGSGSSMSGGKMDGGKMYGGKMYGRPTASPAPIGITVDLAVDSETAPSGKNGGKMAKA